ncbi:unnamed protein product [Ambrosiozyma monospora]|uniref:Unnamed protein product n=1 Tax=Ambrosiozyma monospora TaxID=43982 RepID=A0ACB5TJB5_AMBMO|nr:unnamed protein product [Ambrosiozyma monospora]
MKESQIRSLISKLQTLQIIEVQEIPKTMDRQATRSVFAFRFKYKKALNVFKESLMFNMAEVLDHLEDVKLENKILLDKISREDVKGKEHELLLTSELVQLQKYYTFEKMSLARLARLRSGVEVFHFMKGL